MLIVLLAITFLRLGFNCVESNYISGQIEGHVGFHFRKLSDFPSKMATIGFSIYTSKKVSERSPILTFHTEEENINVQKRCLEFHYGQFYNEKMIVFLNKHTQDCTEINDKVRCTGETVIQDYLPRNYFFSLGFGCHSIGSLKGLQYNISISKQTNTTECSNMTFETPCLKYYPQFSMPNLLGISHEDIRKYYELQNYIYLINQKFGEVCFQHLEEMIC